MQRTHEILSLAAYLPLEVLPEGVRQDILTDLRKGFLCRYDITDENTELFFLKAEGDSCDYQVTVSTVFSEDEPPEVEIIYLGLTEQERKEVDRLIIERMQYALQHVSEI